MSFTKSLRWETTDYFALREALGSREGPVSSDLDGSVWNAEKTKANIKTVPHFIQVNAEKILHYIQGNPQNWESRSSSSNSLKALKGNDCFIDNFEYLRELIEMRGKLASAQEIAETSATATATAQSECASLMKEIKRKTEVLQEHEAHAVQLSQQLTDLHAELKLKESSEKQLKDELETLRMKMKLEVANVASIKDAEMNAILEELLYKNTEELSKGLKTKDDEIARLKEEIKLLSAQVKIKAQELETQRERQLASEQDLKKRILKLEFWLQEARAQTRKLQKVIEKRDKELKDLRAQIECSGVAPKKAGPGIWGNPRFRLLASVSAAVLLFCAKR